MSSKRMVFGVLITVCRMKIINLFLHILVYVWNKYYLCKLSMLEVKFVFYHYIFSYEEILVFDICVGILTVFYY